MELSKTGQMGIDYHITLDMAKELAMVENNDKGREAQIELERLKEWRNKVAIKLRREGVKEDVINNLLKN